MIYIIESLRALPNVALSAALLVVASRGLEREQQCNECSHSHDASEPMAQRQSQSPTPCHERGVQHVTIAKAWLRSSAYDEMTWFETMNATDVLRDDGVLVGRRVFDRGRSNILAAMGLQNGDVVVAVQGARAFESWSWLTKFFSGDSEVYMLIERRGQPIEIHYLVV